MGVDSSIALAGKPVEIADPLQNAYKAQLLKSSMVQNDMAGLQQQQLRDAMSREQGANTVLGDQSNYKPHEITGVPQLTPEAQQNLARTGGHKALTEYNTNFATQQKNWFELQEQQQKAKDAELKHAENVLSWREKMTIGQNDAYERALLLPGGTEESARAEADRVGAIIYQQGVAAVPELGKAQLQPFDPNVARANLAKNQTFKDHLEALKLQGGDGEEWSTTPQHDGNGNAFLVSKSGKLKWLDKDGKPITRQQEYGPPVAGQDAEHNALFVSGGKYGDASGAPQMVGRSENQLFPANKSNDKPLTESERKYTGFYQSMTNASKEIDAVTKKVPRLPFVSLMIEDEPGYAAQIGNAVKRGLMSADQQRAYTGYRKFISDVQYMTTGFGITATEWPKMWSTYVPLPGDTDETVQLKARLRQQEILRAETGGGRGVEQLREREKGAPAAPTPPEIKAKRWGTDGKVTTTPKDSGEFGNVQGGGSSVTAPKAIQLPPEVRNELQEGQETEFSNGTVWTLENGEPKQLR